jgi:tetratricopeptide (TPR) repeat protein
VSPPREAVVRDGTVGYTVWSSVSVLTDSGFQQEESELKACLGFLCSGIGTAVLLAAIVAPAAAEKVNCSNEFRSGKLYFSQKLFEKAVHRFALSVETCPEKADYRGRYAIALAQYGGERLEDVLVFAPSEEAKAATIDSVVTMYQAAGAQFDTSKTLDPGKKNQKFVRENREHFWVERYNKGVKLLKEGKHEIAALEFHLARLLDPTRPLAYSQGAIALIYLDRKQEAATLVQAGLEREPEDKKLNDLLETIYIDAADDLIEECERSVSDGNTEEAVGKASEAVAYLDQVLERRGGGDENLIFKRGTAHLAGGSAQGEDGTESFKAAAADFSKAAELVSYEDDANFHLAALFNQIQSLLKVGDCEGAIVVIKDFISKDYKDAGIWRSWAICLSEKEDPQAAVAALMLSKSLDGEAVDVQSAVEVAKEDAAAAVQALGPPDFIRTYQEASSGNQIESWFWIDERTAMSFILGVKNGEMTW